MPVLFGTDSVSSDYLLKELKSTDPGITITGEPGVKSHDDPSINLNYSVIASNHAHEASSITYVNGPLSQSALPNIDATKLTGTINPARLPDIDASKITTGTLKPEVLPPGASNRYLPVANMTTTTINDLMASLSSFPIHVGDVISDTSDSPPLLYYVSAPQSLPDPSGYVPFSAGVASNVDWEGLTGTGAASIKQVGTSLSSTQILNFSTKIDLLDTITTQDIAHLQSSNITNLFSANTITGDKFNNLVNPQSKNLVFASPSDSAGAPAFRQLTSIDLPELSSGQVLRALSPLSPLSTSFLAGPSVIGGNPIFRGLTVNDITLSGSDILNKLNNNIQEHTFLGSGGPSPANPVFRQVTPQDITGLSALTSTDLSNLSSRVTTINSLSTTAISSMNSVAALSALTTTAIGTLNSPSVLAGIQNLSTLSSVAISGLNSTTTINGLNNLSNLTTTQISNLTGTAISGLSNLGTLTSTQVASLTTTAIAGLNNISSLTTTQIAGLTTTAMSGLQNLASFSSTSIANLTNSTSIAGLQNLASLSTTAISGLTATAISGLNKFSSLSTTAIAGLTSTAITGMSNLGSLSSTVLSSLNATTIQGLSNLAQLNTTQIQNLYGNLCTGVPIPPVSSATAALTGNSINLTNADLETFVNCASGKTYNLPTGAPDGSVITFVLSPSGTASINPATLAGGASTTYMRTLTAPALATALSVTSAWIISGAGVT